MIQFNLLPDVKLEYIKARRTKRLVVMVSTIVAGASVAITLILFIATNGIQRRHLNNLDKHIKDLSGQLEDEKDLDKILTVQNQLSVLDELHAQKPAAARLSSYLPQIVPENVTITKLEMSFSDTTITFNGSAGSLGSVNKFIDILKFTTYKAGDNQGKAFSSVVLSDFGRSDEQAASGDPTTYQITLNFDPHIFSLDEKAELIVPNTVTTRSAIESPTSPFQDSENAEDQ